VSAYKPLGISATHLDMAYRQLMAQLSSVAELAKENLKGISAKIASKKVDIKREEKARDKARKNAAKLEAGSGLTWKQRRKLLVDASTRDHAGCLFALKMHLGELHAKLAAIRSVRRIRPAIAASFRFCAIYHQLVQQAP
jgi:hypothetical protein